MTKGYVNQCQHNNMSISTATTHSLRIAKVFGKSSEYPIGTQKTTEDGIIYLIVQDKNGNHRWMKKDKVKKSKVPKTPLKVVSEPTSNASSDLSDSDADVKRTVAKTKKPKTISTTVKKEVAKDLKKAFDEVSSKPAAAKQHVRKAPAQHANLYSEGDQEMGLDGNMWEVKATKNGVLRWVAV